MSKSAKFRSNEVSLAEKALAACREYNRISQKIAENTTEISRNLCENTAAETGYRTCLQIAFDSPEDPSAWAGVNECQDCSNIYKAIQERKENRRLLGAVKRKIRRIAER